VNTKVLQQCMHRRLNVLCVCLIHSNIYVNFKQRDSNFFTYHSVLSALLLPYVPQFKAPLVNSCLFISVGNMTWKLQTGQKVKHNGRTADRQCHVANDSTILPRFLWQYYKIILWQYIHILVLYSLVIYMTFNDCCRLLNGTVLSG
jgi:hypothetical protein